jgi:hypothetical protein
MKAQIHEASNGPQTTAMVRPHESMHAQRRLRQVYTGCTVLVPATEQKVQCRLVELKIYNHYNQ